MITCISYRNLLAMLEPKCINIAPQQTWVIYVAVFDGISNTGYAGLKWGILINVDRHIVNIISQLMHVIITNHERLNYSQPFLFAQYH